MNLLAHRTWLVALGAAATITMLAAVGVALAAGPSNVAATPTASNAATNAKYCEGFLGHLAGDLGKSQSDVSGAVSKAMGQTLDDAVKNGDLTRSQADKIKSRLTSGGGGCQAFGRFGDHFGAGKAMRHGFLSFGLDIAAEALKITPAELRQDLGKGMTLHQIADSKRVTHDQFKASVDSSLTQKLDQAVQSGRVTKDQEAKILSRADQAISTYWDRSLPHR
jgi:ribosomal protein S20